MKTPQEGIFAEGSNCFYHLEYKIDAAADVEAVKKSIKQSLAPVSKDIHVVVAFGSDFWNKINPSCKPEGLVSFTDLNGVKGFSAKSTQQDVLFWLHSQSEGLNFDQVKLVHRNMAKVADLNLDIRGLSYYDSKDLIGFKDGTANAEGDLRKEHALVPAGKAGEGGSFMLTQKWVHDLEKFESMGVKEQEQVVGRTKVEDIELEGDDMPVDSHVSRTDLKIDGTALKIYRRSSPYGNATVNGLYFLSFSCEMRRLSEQLKSMYGLTEDKIHDRIIEFSQAKTSSYWFAPAVEDLEILK